jgi:predicted CoA-binding protein
MPSRAVIDEFLAQDRIAFVGASRDSKQFANSVYTHLRDAGHTMIPVHPEADAIEGDPAVHDVSDLPTDIGGIVVMLPPEAMTAMVARCLDAGVPRVWLHRGAGAAPPAEAVQACRDRGVPVVDGACPFMFVEPVGGVHKFHRWFARRRVTA